jgi:hypothetical protein
MSVLFEINRDFPYQVALSFEELAMEVLTWLDERTFEWDMYVDLPASEVRYCFRSLADATTLSNGSSMQRKGELSSAADRAWPHQVVLPARLCERDGYSEIHEFCRDLTLCSEVIRSITTANGFTFTASRKQWTRRHSWRDSAAKSLVRSSVAAAPVGQNGKKFSAGQHRRSRVRGPVVFGTQATDFSRNFCPRERVSPIYASVGFTPRTFSASALNARRPVLSSRTNKAIWPLEFSCISVSPLTHKLTEVT